ncbi:MAG: tetratricopeptide repeat protein [Deltaproteobacteria bacterium]|nr:tetratricopeptide repeat protein [Deltaproteobacteria bacterium]
MSYINEALKKAQKEKEARHQRYPGVASTPGYKARVFPGKALWLTAFFLASLAFAAYLWLPSGDTQPPGIEPAQPKATPQPPGSKPAQPKATPQPPGSKPAQPKATPQPPGSEPARPKATPQQKSVGNVKALYERARVFHKRGRLQEAMRLYERTLSLNPEYVDALNNLGVIHIQNRRYSAARESFAKAIRLRPDYVDSHYNLACVHALEGAVSQSLIHLKRAVSLDQSVKNWARGDADLRNLHGVQGFEQIIGRGVE